MSTSRPFHHGDLKAALARRALTMVEVSGVEAVSLRQVAREAGVSSAAPYRHYPSRDALLAEVARHGFDLLREQLQAEEAQDHPDRSLRLCLSYIRFAIEHPALYRLMFGAQIEKASCPDLLESGKRALRAAGTKRRGFGSHTAGQPRLGLLGTRPWPGHAGTGQAIAGATGRSTRNDDRRYPQTAHRGPGAVISLEPPQTGPWPNHVAWKKRFEPHSEAACCAAHQKTQRIPIGWVAHLRCATPNRQTGAGEGIRTPQRSSSLRSATKDSEGSGRLGGTSQMCAPPIGKLERAKGFEPSTPTLARCPTPFSSNIRIYDAARYSTIFQYFIQTPSRRSYPKRTLQLTPKRLEFSWIRL